MNTSSFFKFKGSNGISIAIKAPPTFKGSSYAALFPKWSFLSQYFKDKDEVLYTKHYNEEILSVLSPQQVYTELCGKTLLCWEPAGAFCHRRLVADWIYKSIGIIVPEI